MAAVVPVKADQHGNVDDSAGAQSSHATPGDAEAKHAPAPGAVGAASQAAAAGNHHQFAVGTIVMKRYHADFFIHPMMGMLDGPVKLLSQPDVFFRKSVLHALTVIGWALCLAAVVLPMVIAMSASHNSFLDEWERAGFNTTQERRSIGPHELFDPSEAFFWEWTMSYAATGFWCIFSIVTGLMFVLGGKEHGWSSPRLWKYSLVTLVAWFSYTVFAFALAHWIQGSYPRLVFLGPAFSGTILGAVWVAWRMRSTLLLGAIHKTLAVQLLTLGSVLFLYAETVPRFFLKTDSEVMKAVLRLVLHPLLFEVANSTTRLAVVTYPAELRRRLVVFLLTPYFMNALLGRFLVASMQTIEGTLIVSSGLVLMEMGLRGSAAMRDQFIARFIYGKQRAHSLFTGLTHRRMMSDIAWLDELSECFGILLAPAIVWYYHIQAEQDLSPLVFGAAYQLGVEAIVNISSSLAVLMMHGAHENYMKKLGLDMTPTAPKARNRVVRRLARHSSLETDEPIGGPAHGEFQRRDHLTTVSERTAALKHSNSADGDLGGGGSVASDTARPTLSVGGSARLAPLTGDGSPPPASPLRPAPLPSVGTAQSGTSSEKGAAGRKGAEQPLLRPQLVIPGQLPSPIPLGRDLSTSSTGSAGFRGRQRHVLLQSGSRDFAGAAAKVAVVRALSSSPHGTGSRKSATVSVADAEVGIEGGDADSGQVQPSGQRDGGKHAVPSGGGGDGGEAFALHPFAGVNPLAGGSGRLAIVVDADPRGSARPRIVDEATGKEVTLHSEPLEELVAAAGGGGAATPNSNVDTAAARQGRPGATGRTRGGPQRAITSGAKNAIDEALHRIKSEQKNQASVPWTQLVMLQGVSAVKRTRVNCINAWEDKFEGFYVASALFAMAWTAYFLTTFFYPGVIVCGYRLDNGAWQYDVCQ